METTFALKGYLQRENERIKTDIQTVLNICSSLNIYCDVVHEVWGIWFEIDRTKYLVDPTSLINSLFEDDTYYLLELYPKPKEEGCYAVEVHRLNYCYSWQLHGGLSKDPRPICFEFQEYASKIRRCVETLYAAMSAGKTTAYNRNDCSVENLKIAVDQMKISAVIPSYYRITTSMVEEESFVFQIEEDKSNELYTIGIDNRKYTTWLTHWYNNYDIIRHELESFIYHKEASIHLSFDMSELILKIRHVSVLDQIKEMGNGYGFDYKDYAVVEIHPNEFVHGTIIKGYCDLKQTIKTFYEGLLTLALAHGDVCSYGNEPSQIEAYNMFKSPLIERNIASIDEYSLKADLRQVHVKRMLKIYPDYDEVIFDSEGKSVDIDGEDGYIDELYDKDGNPFMVEGLKGCQEIVPVVLEGAVGRTVDSFNWKSYHERGLLLAQQLRTKLSDDFDLWYMAPVEDKSGIVNKPVFVYNVKQET